MLHQISFLSQRVSEWDRATFHVYKDPQFLISLLILSNQVILVFIQQLFCAFLVKQVLAHLGAQTIFLQHLNKKDFEIYLWESFLKFTDLPYRTITLCLIAFFWLHLTSTFHFPLNTIIWLYTWCLKFSFQTELKKKKRHILRYLLLNFISLAGLLLNMHSFVL